MLSAKVEHRLGEVLHVTVNHGGVAGRAGPGRGKTSSTVLPVSESIPDGITRMQSSRAQQLAAIPWREQLRPGEVTLWAVCLDEGGRVLDDGSGAIKPYVGRPVAEVPNVRQVYGNVDPLVVTGRRDPADSPVCQEALRRDRAGPWPPAA
jgi:hypothetical protein